MCGQVSSWELRKHKSFCKLIKDCTFSSTHVFFFNSSNRLEDAIDSKTVQTKVVTVTQTLVDGKVVAESKDIKSSEKEVK